MGEVHNILRHQKEEGLEVIGKLKIDKIIWSSIICNLTLSVPVSY